MIDIQSKTAQAVGIISNVLLTLPTTTMPPIKTLAERAKVGIGTASKALDFLEMEGAVSTVGVQRYGTVIKEIDYVKLWALSGRGAVRGILPMPVSLSVEELADAVTAGLKSLGIELSLTFREGALRRLDSLRDNVADFTIISGNTLSICSGIQSLYQFKTHSYYGKQGVYRLHLRNGASIKRVAADESSPDHLAMVKEEFPDAEIVNAPIRHIPGMIAANEIDATIWYGGMSVPAEYINSLEISVTLSDVITHFSKTPAVVVAMPDSALPRIFSMLDPGTMEPGL